MGYARPFELESSAEISRVEPARIATDKLLGLELLRFVSAMAVLFFHYDHFAKMAGVAAAHHSAFPLYAVLWPLYDYGQYGVQVFWGISGYIFFWKYGSAIHARAVSARDFFWLRFSRLYPLHFATLFGIIGLQALYRQLEGHNFIYPTDDAGQFVGQLFLATDWGPQPPFSFNGPIWSISAEVAVYAAFFLAARKFAPTIGLCLGSVIAGLALQLAGLEWVSAYCATYFFAGGLAALAGPRVARPACFLLIAVTLVAVATGSIHDHDKLPMVLLLAVPCLLVMVAKDWRPLERLQTPIQFAGNLTYSSYLLHFPLQLLLAIAVAATDMNLPLESGWFLGAYLSLTLGAAAASYRWFELPAQRWIRQRTCNKYW